MMAARMIRRGWTHDANSAEQRGTQLSIGLIACLAISYLAVAFAFSVWAEASSDWDHGPHVAAGVGLIWPALLVVFAIIGYGECVSKVARWANYQLRREDKQ